MNTLLFHDVIADVKDTGAPLQLRDVAAALRKQDDVNGVLKALQQAGPLVAAAPDELSAYAGAVTSCLNPAPPNAAVRCPAARWCHDGAAVTAAGPAAGRRGG